MPFVTGETDRNYDPVEEKYEVKPRDFRGIEENRYVIYN